MKFVDDDDDDDELTVLTSIGKYFRLRQTSVPYVQVRPKTLDLKNFTSKVFGYD